MEEQQTRTKVVKQWKIANGVKEDNATDQHPTTQLALYIFGDVDGLCRLFTI